MWISEYNFLIHQKKKVLLIIGESFSFDILDCTIVIELEKSKGATPVSENISVLIVDDEDRIRRLLKMYLEREGYIVDEAENGH